MENFTSKSLFRILLSSGGAMLCSTILLTASVGGYT
jgi:hypothetical protein